MNLKFTHAQLYPNKSRVLYATEILGIRVYKEIGVGEYYVDERSLDALLKIACKGDLWYDSLFYEGKPIIYEPKLDFNVVVI